MRFPTAVLAMVAGLALSTPAQAQDAPTRLQAGNWTGTVTPPGEQTVDLVFAVSYAGDTLRITMNAGPHGNYEAIEPKLEEGKLSFGLNVGQPILCVLDPKDKGYVGYCTEDSGEAAPMEMWPPHKQEN